MNKMLKTFLCLSAMAMIEKSAHAIYVHYSEIHPAQIAYASPDVHAKVMEVYESGNAKLEWDNAAPYASANIILHHCDGQSIFPPKKQLSVVKAPFGYVLIDGHHKVLASLRMNASMISIKVVEDWSLLSEDVFWYQAEQKGWAYPYTISGQYAKPPRTFDGMIDEPYRWLPYLLKGLVPEDSDVTKYTGPDYPVWLKIGEDIPFIEFKIGQALYKNGIRYAYQDGDNLSPAFVEQCREILLKENIPGLRVVPTRKHKSELADMIEHKKNVKE